MMKFISIHKALFATGIIISILVTPFTSVAQFSIENRKVDKDVKSAFSALYNFKFEKAHEFMSNTIEDENNNAWYYFTVSNIQLWEIFASFSNEELKNEYRENLDHHFHYCNQLSNNKEARFLRIMYYTYLTRLTMNEGEYFAAFRAIRNYYHLLEPTFNDTVFAPYLLVDGLYFYLYSYAYDEYTLLRPFLKFYKKGNAHKGLRYLNKASNSPNKIIRTEARYFLMKIWFDLENNPQKAFTYAQLLYHSYPGNFIFNMYYHKISKSLDPYYSLDLEKIRDRILSNAQLDDDQKMYFEYLLRFHYPA